MKIYIESRDYATYRNILTNKYVSNYGVLLNVNRVLASLVVKVLTLFGFKVPSKIFKYKYFFKSYKKNDGVILHTFNSVVADNRPWVTTFETIVPRLPSSMSFHHGDKINWSALKNDKEFLKGIEYICSDNCKGIIALSICNYNMQLKVLDLFPEFKEKMMSKLFYIPPPQKAFNIDRKFDKNLRLMFVGNLFFCKGGMELLKVFSLLSKEINIELTIVSTLSTDDYATKTTSKDVKNALNIISSNKKIKIYKNISNNTVIELMKEHDVGVLLSYAETYGYSVLEFQSVGCPVISTNVRALSELNNNKLGWIIDIPKNELGEAIYTNKESRKLISEIIKKQLHKIICDIYEDRNIIINKRNRAISNIIKKHDIDSFSEKVNDVYKR